MTINLSIKMLTGDMILTKGAIRVRVGAKRSFQGIIAVQVVQNSIQQFM